MKKLIGLLVAGTVGFTAAYFMVSQIKEAELRSEQARLQAEFEQRLEALEAELDKARRAEPRVEKRIEQVAVPAVVRRSADEILANLLELKPVGGARIATIRRIVHELEDLADLKAAALPAIRTFLARNEDLDYSLATRADDSGDRRWTPPWQRSSPPTEFTLPPSLRIGLFDVLKDIGGTGAEEILAEVLGSSGRAVEVAYLARMLEEMAPGRYREVAVAAAKDLLRNPLPIDNPNRLDEQAEGYLYGVLEMYNDLSFGDEARRLLVGADGRLNRNAQQYLAKTQGESVVATFYDAYKSEALSNNWDRISVANRILDYVGPNAQANTFLNEIVSNTNLDSRMRSFAVLRLAGGFGGMDSPTDPAVIAARMQVLDSMRPNVGEERVVRAIDTTRRNLQNLSEGKPVEVPFGGGDRGWDRGRREGEGARN